MIAVRLAVLPVAVAVAATAPSLARAQSAPAIEIQLATDTEAEREARVQLERILRDHDLTRWLFTRTVRVEPRVIPHSHPVLTVNTRYLGNDTAQIATFVHEQLHWFFDRHEARTDSAIAELARLYPGAPDGPPEGARNLQSTYLHLLVCTLEYEAMRTLFDGETARRTLSGWPFYRWIYREVLDRPDTIRRVLRTYGLDAPDARAVGPSSP